MITQLITEIPNETHAIKKMMENMRSSHIHLFFDQEKKTFCLDYGYKSTVPVCGKTRALKQNEQNQMPTLLNKLKKTGATLCAKRAKGNPTTTEFSIHFDL